MKIKHLIIAAFLISICANSAWAQSGTFREYPTFDSSGNLFFAVYAVNDTGFHDNMDSAWVFSRFSGIAAADAGEGEKVFRRTGNTTGNIDSAWIDEFTYGGGTSKESYYFRDKVADWVAIDTLAGNDTLFWDGVYVLEVITFTQGDPFHNRYTFCVRKTGFVDSVVVDGSSLASLDNAIDASVIAADAIGASELATSAIGTDEWAAEADNNGVNWGDLTNKTSENFLTGTTVIGVDVVGSLADGAILSSTFAAGAIDATAISANAIGAAELAANAIGASELAGDAATEIADSTWMARVSKYKTQSTYTTAAFRDSVFAGAYTVGTTSNLIVGMRPNLDSAQGTLANTQVDDDVDVNAKTITAGAIDSADIDPEVYTYLAGLAGDSTLRKSWVFGTGTAGSVGAGIDAIRDSMDEASQTGTATLSAVTMGNISDSVWAKDTSNSLWNGLLNRFGEWNAGAQAATGVSCGSGSQAVTIYVLDTSGVDALVTSYVTIFNSAVTSTMAHGVAMGGITGTFGLTASTAYKGLAVAAGYYFPLYSFTTGAGASHTDTIRGYDVPTSSGSAVPSSQQVQLYDWVISPGNDTLYGADVTITLAGSSKFYTSTNLVPPATVVVHAGLNDGTANGGKWQKTIFGTDSLFSSGVDNATYTITITHPSLKLPIVYEGLSIPASATPIRLRQILEDQE